MITETTLVIIKPNAMRKNLTGVIIKRFQEKGLKISGLKLIKMSLEFCQQFYEEHKARPFFNELVEFMSSCPVVVLALSGEGAVSFVRQLLGDTDPKKAKPGSLRFMYGDSVGENALHGSDSFESARREIDLLFAKEELFF